MPVPPGKWRQGWRPALLPSPACRLEGTSTRRIPGEWHCACSPRRCWKVCRPFPTVSKPHGSAALSRSPTLCRSPAPNAPPSTLSESGGRRSYLQAPPPWRRPISPRYPFPLHNLRRGRLPLRNRDSTTSCFPPGQGRDSSPLSDRFPLRW